MKNVQNIALVVLAALVAILFYLQLVPAKPAQADKKDVKVEKAFKMAYFEMDSVENAYEYVKDVKKQLRSKEEGIQKELANLESTYRARLNMYNQRGSSMSQTEGEAAQRDLMQQQQNFNSRRQILEQELAGMQEKLALDVNKRIETFLKEYNKDGRFAYIMIHQPGLIYFRDTAFDITADVVKGLNAAYQKK